METARIPKVSVIVPAYRVSQYIRETLDSVLSQTFRGYEIIVVNGASPDTAQLEAVLQPYLPHIIYVKDDRPGQGRARNIGIQHARGEFLAFLDGDDLWRPEFLEKQLAAFRRDPSLDLVYADSIHFGEGLLVGRSFFEVCPS